MKTRLLILILVILVFAVPHADQSFGEKTIAVSQQFFETIKVLTPDELPKMAGMNKKDKRVDTAVNFHLTVFFSEYILISVLLGIAAAFAVLCDVFFAGGSCLGDVLLAFLGVIITWPLILIEKLCEQ